MVEFALVMTIGAFVLFTSIQLALIGECYLALGKLNYQGARYAALHADCNLTSCSGGEQSPKDYMISIGSPTIVGNGGSNLVFALSPSAPRATGSTVTLSVTFNIPSSIMFLPNPFFGISFPTSLSSTESAYGEGT